MSYHPQDAGVPYCSTCGGWHHSSTAGCPGDSRAEPQERGARSLYDLIADDALAGTYQTLWQYRTALLAALRDAAPSGPERKTYTREEVQGWRDDAFRAAADIARRWGATDAAGDIEAMVRAPAPKRTRGTEMEIPTLEAAAPAADPDFDEGIPGNCNAIRETRVICSRPHSHDGLHSGGIEWTRAAPFRAPAAERTRESDWAEPTDAEVAHYAEISERRTQGETERCEHIYWHGPKHPKVPCFRPVGHAGEHYWPGYSKHSAPSDAAALRSQVAQPSGEARTTHVFPDGSMINHPLEDRCPMCPKDHSHRWNIEETDGGVRVCRGDHDGDNCDWVEYVPKEIAPRAPTREQVEALIEELAVEDHSPYLRRGGLADRILALYAAPTERSE